MLVPVLVMLSSGTEWFAPPFPVLGPLQGRLLTTMVVEVTEVLDERRLCTKIKK